MAGEHVGREEQGARGGGVADALPLSLGGGSQDALLTLREHILPLSWQQTLKSETLGLRHKGLEMPGQRWHVLQSRPEAEQSRRRRRSSLTSEGSSAVHFKPLYQKGLWKICPCGL